MAKKDEQAIEWFGADVEETPDKKRTVSYLPGFKGVDADVERNGVLVRKPAPRHVTVRTRAKDHEIGKLTSRYKLMRSAFQFAPLDDKEMWETRMNIAFAEMQIERFRQKLARYEAQPNPRPEQVELLKSMIYRYRGQFAELTGQA